MLNSSTYGHELSLRFTTSSTPKTLDTSQYSATLQAARRERGQTVQEVHLSRGYQTASPWTAPRLSRRPGLAWPRLRACRPAADPATASPSLSVPPCRACPAWPGCRLWIPGSPCSSSFWALRLPSKRYLDQHARSATRHTPCSTPKPISQAEGSMLSAHRWNTTTPSPVSPSAEDNPQAFSCEHLTLMPLRGADKGPQSLVIAA